MTKGTSHKPPAVKPVSHFTRDLSAYGSLSRFTVIETSEAFWEHESLMFYVRQGHGTLYVNGEPYPIEAGSLAFLHTFHIFSFAAEENSPLVMTALRLPCVEMLYDVIDQVDNSYSIWPACVLSRTENRKRIEEIFHLYQEEIENPPINGLLLHAFMGQLNNIFYEEAAIWRKSHQEPARTLNVQILLYVWEWRTSPLTARKVAETFQMSVQALNTRLRGLCGCNFQQLLNRARVAYAYPVLFQTGISVQSLAAQAGFPNEKAFFRAFQAVFGYGPREYREYLLHSQDSSVVHLIGDKSPDIVGYILKNYRKQVTAKSCMKELFWTEADINQVLRKVFPADSVITFHSFLTELRLRFAVGVLTTWDIPIYDISIYAGFNSVHTFIRQFKKKYGMTPSEYRQHAWEGLSNER